MEEPAYKMLVRRSIDTEPATYCVDCLGDLWSNRAEARHVMGHASHQSRSSDKQQTDLHHIFKQCDSTMSSSVVNVGKTRAPRFFQSKPNEVEWTGMVSEGYIRR